MRYVTALAALALLVAAPSAFAADTRYSLANDCWTLKSASAPVSDGPFFLKATDLGSYMFFDKNKGYLSADSSPLAAAGGGLTRAGDGGPDGDWKLEDASGGAFKVLL